MTSKFTKNNLMNRRKKVWVCKVCSTYHFRKPKNCAICNKVNFHYFDSKIEAKRWEELRLMLRGGIITHLELSPVFQVTINKVDIFKYIADFSYRDNISRLIVEDVKPKGFQTEVFKLKRKAVEAQYQIKISIIEY